MAGKVRYGKACYVTAGQREERCGMAGRVSRVPVSLGVRGKVWYGRQGLAGQVEDRPGVVRRGEARTGKAGTCKQKS